MRNAACRMFLCVCVCVSCFGHQRSLFLRCWQWTPPLWLLIWSAAWRGCVEEVVRPTSAWPSCGSSSSLPAPTCAGSGPFTRPSSERAPLLWDDCYVLDEQRHPWRLSFTSVQDRQLVQLHGFLLRLHGTSRDQYHPDGWHSWLGSVVRMQNSLISLSWLAEIPTA